FLPADRVTTGWSKLGRFGYALACFIFRFLRRPQLAQQDAWIRARRAAIDGSLGRLDRDFEKLLK
ncbi:hypothetical protein, partial [Cupriavidus sp. SHE]|uniref:hypothetical protein n=1 Tax=Cupriavidus sp. SHE TaxID=1539143 RepID=UPI00057992D2